MRQGHLADSRAARGCRVEAYDERPNRTQVKRRKAHVKVGELANGSKALYSSD